MVGLSREHVTREKLILNVIKYVTFVLGGFLGWLIIIVVHLFLSRGIGVDIRFFGVDVQLSYAIGLIIAILLVFLYHRFLTFRMRSRWKRRLSYFFVTEVIIAVFNWLLFVVGVWLLGQYIPDFSFSFAFTADEAEFLASRFVLSTDVQISFWVTTLLSVPNFLINRFFVFRHH